MQNNVTPDSMPSDFPAISVIIPMYNREEYIAECLESILNQTFQDFEVIVVDDCSTDNSVAVVSSYSEKFGGRLKLAKTEENTGHPGEARNLGLKLANGEYIMFVDSDDFIMLNALENLYTAAKEYDTDVVYTSAYYLLYAPNEIQVIRDGKGSKLFKENLEDESVLIIDDPNKLLQQLVFERAFNFTWVHFVRRDFLLQNNIIFPKIFNGEDHLWVIKVCCHSKRFLRVSTPFYFYKRYNTESICVKEKEPHEQVSQWITGFVTWMKLLNELANEEQILKDNPDYCFAAAKRNFQWCLQRIKNARDQLSNQDIYEILYREYAEDSSNSSVPFLFSLLDTQNGEISSIQDKYTSVLAEFTARVDVKLVPKTAAGDFQIFSVSDDKADILKPDWFQKGGIGYQIQSYSGNLSIAAKAFADGQILLTLRALDVRDPSDNSKRIPCWIDYTKLVVNGEVIFDNLTSAWHDKPFRYNLDVKADDEITLQVEWGPHKDTDRSLTQPKGDLIFPAHYTPPTTSSAISVIIPMYNAEKYIGECLDSLSSQTFRDFEVIIVDDCSTDNSIEVVKSYIEKFGKQLKIAKTEKNSGGCAVPRNVGFPLSCGEYVFFMDADDVFTQTALEEMYTLAKEYDADVVYCEKYFMSSGIGEELKNNIHLADSKIQKPPFVDKPTLETNDLSERIKKLLDNNYWMAAWLKLVKRDFLIENRIDFPLTFISEDFIWNSKLLFCSKRFLRIPNICYIRRMHEDSIMGSNRTTSDQVQRWMDVVIRCVKDLDNFMKRIEFFEENPAYRYEILNRLAMSNFDCIFDKCSAESPFEVYKIFKDKFGNLLGERDVLVSLLCSRVLDSMKGRGRTASKNLNLETIPQKDAKLTAEQEAKIEQFKAKVEDFLSSEKVLPALNSTVPAISIVIPLYNEEELIGECLNSLLVQTFLDFEVLLVDDCSTDNSVEIIESYTERFGGRLKLVHTETNSGAGGYVPRNMGIELASGEYIYFMDADDFVLDNALETLHNAAKRYNADVVYTGSYYGITASDKYYLHRDSEGRQLINAGLEDKTNLRVNAPNKNLRKLLLEGRNGNFRGPWTKLTRRKVLVENNIVFPTQITNGGDFIWVIDLYCHAKRFLRISTPVYFYRSYNTKSVTNIKRDPSKQVAHWISGFVAFAKLLRDLENENEILSENPIYGFAALETHFWWYFGRCYEELNQLSKQEIYEVLRREFAKDSSDITIPFFFSTIDEKQKEIEDLQRKHKSFFNKFTARVDVQLVPKTGTGDFQIISVSDNEADVLKPDWLQREGVGYQIQSYGEKMEIVTKAFADGQIKLNLRGLDVRDPKDKSKRIPYWIDYKKLTINGKTIFNKVTPAWHDKSYFHKMDVKTGEEIKIQVEWLPHRDDTLNISTDNAKLIEKFKTYFTARVDLKLFSKTSSGEFKIVSVSDNKAAVWKPNWLQKGGIGYQINSYNGNMEIVAKADTNGRIVLDLLGLDIRDPKDKSKRIPYWIDYTKLAVNGKIIFNKLTPVWHDKPYTYRIDVKANEKIKIQVEWLPHRDDTIDVSANIEELQKKSSKKDALIAELQAALDTEKKIHSDDAELIHKFSDYFTSRIDLKLVSTSEGKLKILSASDEKATIKRAGWLPKNESGYFIQSYAGKMEIIAKATADGQINLDLRGLDVRNPEDKSKRIPYWIDYTKLVVNGEVLFEELTPVWHNKPFKYNMNANADEEIKIEVEWQPHKDDSLNVSANVEELQAKSSEKDTQINKLQVALNNEKKSADKQKVLIAELQAALDTEKKIHSDDAELIHKFSDYFTSRIDLKLVSTSEGKLKILSASDEKATIKRAGWLPKNESGYFIHSYAGKMEIIAKATADGQINLDLRGLDVRNPEDKSKRIPYWIDYTKLVVNGEVLFDELTPVWHNKPYRYNLDVKADEEIKIKVEWQPHRSDI